MTKRPAISQQITFIYVRNLEVSARFYGGTLGLELFLDQGSCQIFRAAGRGLLGICARQGKEPQTGSVILTLVTTEVAAWYHYLEEEGVKLPEPPVHNPDYQIEHFFIRDPDGYLVEIQRFLDPRWGE